MANDEHIALLKKGVDAWNAWRQENPDIQPDLSEAHLEGVDLSAILTVEAKASLPDEANFSSYGDILNFVSRGLRSGDR